MIMKLFLKAVILILLVKKRSYKIHACLISLLTIPSASGTRSRQAGSIHCSIHIVIQYMRYYLGHNQPENLALGGMPSQTVDFSHNFIGTDP